MLKLIYSCTRPVLVALLQEDLLLEFEETVNKAGTGWFLGTSISCWIKFQKLEGMNLKSRTKAFIQRQVHIASRISNIFETIITKHLAVLFHHPQNKHRRVAPSEAVTVRALRASASPWGLAAWTQHARR